MKKETLFVSFTERLKQVKRGKKVGKIKARQENQHKPVPGRLKVKL